MILLIAFFSLIFSTESREKSINNATITAVPNYQIRRKISDNPRTKHVGTAEKYDRVKVLQH